MEGVGGRVRGSNWKKRYTEERLTTGRSGLKKKKMKEYKIL